MRKPEVGAYYRVWNDAANEPYNLMKITRIEGEFAYYIKIDFPEHIQRWNFKKFPECLDYKLTPVEVELI